MKILVLAALCIFPGLLGAGWKAKQKLPTAEAHQAAAADRDFYYAISSRGIAKYDRKSGKRVATSEGEAKHLNYFVVFIA